MANSRRFCTWWRLDSVADRTARARELQGACAWLQEHEYISCEIKRVKQQVWDARGYKNLAFWALAEKGHAYSGANEMGQGSVTSVWSAWRLLC